MRHIIRYVIEGDLTRPWHVLEVVDHPLVPHEHRVAMNKLVYKARTLELAELWIKERDPEWQN